MTDAPRLTQHEQRSVDLFDKLYHDPEFGPALRKKAKETYPDIRVPEDSLGPLVAPLQKQIETLAEQNKALIDKMAKREADEQERATFQSLESRVTSAVSKFSLTDEGRAKMLDRMKETGNYTDPEAAAAFIAHTAPKPAALPSWAPQSMNLFGSKEYDESLALLHRNPSAYEDQQLIEFAKDPDKYVAETFGRVA